MRICRVSSSSPRPKPSTPALLEITVRFLTPESRKRLDQRLGNAAQSEPANRQRLAVRQDSLPMPRWALPNSFPLAAAHIGHHLSSAGSMLEFSVRPAAPKHRHMRTCALNGTPP